MVVNWTSIRLRQELLVGVQTIPTLFATAHVASRQQVIPEPKPGSPGRYSHWMAWPGLACSSRTRHEQHDAADNVLLCGAGRSLTVSRAGTPLSLSA